MFPNGCNPVLVDRHTHIIDIGTTISTKGKGGPTQRFVKVREKADGIT